MALSTKIEELCSKIHKIRVELPSKGFFVSPSEFRHAFNETAVKDAIAELDLAPQDRLGLAEDILNRGIITFGILIRMGRANDIVNFRRYDCLDAQLPLYSGAQAQKVAPDFWEMFIWEEQWPFLPFNFPPEMHRHHCMIDENCILPFVRIETIGEGAHGEISKAWIPCCMQAFPELEVDDNQNVCVMRKQLKPHGDGFETEPGESFLREDALLRLLNTERHRNIVPFLGSYSHGREHVFLFPPLRGDLETLFQGNSDAAKFPRLSTWCFAMHGLASALEHTHDLHLEQLKHGVDVDAIGSHNDLRPRNILISDDTLMLADFGLGELKHAPSDSDEIYRTGLGDYLAPECWDSNLMAQKVGRSIDVWAFGCFLVELLTYLYQGSEGLEKFRKSRLGEFIPGWKFSVFHERTGRLKESVHKQLRTLRDQSSDTTRELLKVATMALESDREARPSIRNIRRSLAIPVLRVLHTEVFEAFRIYEEAASAYHLPLSIGLYSLGDRLEGFEHALSLVSDNDWHPLREEELHDKCYRTLESIFDCIQDPINSIKQQTTDDLQSIVLNTYGSRFELMLKPLVEALWASLPQHCRKRAEAACFDSKLADDPERLKRLEMYKTSLTRESSSELGCRAKMKAILLEMRNDANSGAAEFLLAPGVLTSEQRSDFHIYGIYNKKERVLVEWMYYRPEQESVSADQRIRTMELRAKNFGVVPKPSGLRLLNCLGFVQTQNSQSDECYGFLYRLPVTATTTGGDLIPLSKLVAQKDSEPPLHVKFQMAFSLATFLKEFHSNCGLHENLNSQNVVFADHPAEAGQWDHHYIIGLQKTRPSGRKWATEGPSDDTLSQRFEQDPEYLQHGRFERWHDYYSLGLILLEIGNWMSLKKYFHVKREQYDQEKIEDLRRFRDKLIRTRVSGMERWVGTIYTSVVRKCLDGSLARKPEDRHLDERENFEQEVVTVLEHLSQLNI